MDTAACAGVKDDGIGPVAGYRGRGERGNQALTPDFPGFGSRHLLLLSCTSSHLATTGGLRPADSAAGTGGSSQLRLLPHYSHFDDDVAVLHLPVWVLEDCRDGAVFQGSGEPLGSAGCVFYHLPDPGGGLRVFHSFSRVLPDDLAIAPR